MTGEQNQEVKRTALKLYRAGRISLETVVWAMKNAGYTEKETAKIYGNPDNPKARYQVCVNITLIGSKLR
jgi:hypothetical protein